VTSSRDGKVVAWKKGEDCKESSLNGWQAAGVLELKNESITAVAFSSNYLSGTDDTYILALGTETGLIKIYQLAQGEWKLLRDLNKRWAIYSFINVFYYKLILLIFLAKLIILPFGDFSSDLGIHSSWRVAARIIWCASTT